MRLLWWWLSIFSHLFVQDSCFYLNICHRRLNLLYNSYWIHWMLSSFAWCIKTCSDKVKAIHVDAFLSMHLSGDCWVCTDRIFYFQASGDNSCPVPPKLQYVKHFLVYDRRFVLCHRWMCTESDYLAAFLCPCLPADPLGESCDKTFHFIPFITDYIMLILNFSHFLLLVFSF